MSDEPVSLTAPPLGYAEWLAELKEDDPKALLKAIAAIAEVKAFAPQLRPPPKDDMEPHEIPVNVEDRRRAGFSV